MEKNHPMKKQRKEFRPVKIGVLLGTITLKIGLSIWLKWLLKLRVSFRAKKSVKKGLLTFKVISNSRTKFVRWNLKI